MVDADKVFLQNSTSAGPFYYDKPLPEKVKCNLPGCLALTRHNGGYCCAEHCKEHRARIVGGLSSFGGTCKSSTDLVSSIHLRAGCPDVKPVEIGALAFVKLLSAKQEVCGEPEGSCKSDEPGCISLLDGL